LGNFTLATKLHATGIMNTDILFAWGAVSKVVNKGQVIFQEGDQARYFFQIETGRVKMFNVNSEGKEFIQGIFGNRESFAEIPLFIDEEYPASCIATQKTVLLQIPKDRFLTILKEYNDIQQEFLIKIARRTYAKSVALRYNTQNSAEQRVLSLLNECRKKNAAKPKQKILICYTRQEIASLTGLRVETVIRVLSELNKKEIVEINDRKLYY
jgi:CRP-like cAMP-binding protein